MPIREAFKYAVSGMAITDLNGYFQQMNPMYCEILGRTEQELQGETVLSVTYPEDRPRCKREMDRLVSGEIPSFVLEKRYLHAGGEPVWVRSSHSLLRNELGDASHMILICNDVTESHRVERLLIESGKLALVGQLATSIAHEINDPLDMILNILYLMKDVEDIDEIRHLVAQAAEQTNRVVVIARHMFQFHKDESKPQVFHIPELVTSVLVLFKGKLASAGVRLKFDSEGDPPVFGHPGEIRQVLANLIRNAIDAMPKGGNLRIQVRSSTLWKSGDRGVRIIIADTGEGMSVATRKRICEFLFTTKGDLGTGLGLWVTAGCISKHRASMRVRSSDTPGTSGTVFMLTFPSVDSEEKGIALFKIDIPIERSKPENARGLQLLPETVPAIPKVIGSGFRPWIRNVSPGTAQSR